MEFSLFENSEHHLPLELSLLSRTNLSRSFALSLCSADTGEEWEKLQRALDEEAESAKVRRVRFTSSRSHTGPKARVTKAEWIMFTLLERKISDWMLTESSGLANGTGARTAAPFFSRSQRKRRRESNGSWQQRDVVQQVTEGSRKERRKVKSRTLNVFLPLTNML